MYNTYNEKNGEKPNYHDNKIMNSYDDVSRKYANTGYKFHKSYRNQRQNLLKNSYNHLYTENE